MNQVDTSPETVEREWNKIAENWGLDLSENSGDSPDGENGGGEYIPNREMSPEERAQKEAVTAQLIKGSLGMVYGMLQLNDMPENITEDFCQSWAVVIVRRFPDNPITDFMDEYGDLIAAGSATLMLWGAARQIKASRKEVAGKVKEAMTDQAGKKPEPAPENPNQRKPLHQAEAA
mgnify:CR=1 FL=1